MIRYKLKTPDGDVDLSLDSEQPNKVSPLVLEGEPRAVMALKRWLHKETGAYGHTLGDWTTPLDLETALRKPSAAKFAPELVERVLGGPAKVQAGPGEG